MTRMDPAGNDLTTVFNSIFLPVNSISQNCVSVLNIFNDMVSTTLGYTIAQVHNPQ